MIPFKGRSAELLEYLTAAREYYLGTENRCGKINVVDVDEDPRKDLVTVVCLFVVLQAVAYKSMSTLLKKISFSNLRDKIHGAFVVVVPVHLRQLLASQLHQVADGMDLGVPCCAAVRHFGMRSCDR